MTVSHHKATPHICGPDKKKEEKKEEGGEGVKTDEEELFLSCANGRENIEKKNQIIVVGKHSSLLSFSNVM